jgi:hypothetical protein
MQFAPHRKHVTVTEPSQLMMCGNTVAVYCEYYRTHRYTLWAVLASQETLSVSGTEPNRLMLSGDTVAVYYENRTEHTNTLRGDSDITNTSIWHT